jgi:hypothetical protein
MAASKLRERFCKDEATGFAAWLSSWKGVLVRFCIIWGCCLVVFLNRYPGTLSSDAVVQLTEAVNVSGYENFNPAIHTFVMTFFVQIGMKIKDITLGVALYTFFQFTLYAAVATYALTVIDKVKTGAVWKILSTLFFIFPTYLMYSSSVSKDTFFATMLLLTLCCAADILISDKPVSVRGKCVLAFLVIVTSMSRNSGWSAILAGGICVMIYYRKKKTQISKSEGQKLRIVAAIEMAGALLAVVITCVVYPVTGIRTVRSDTGTALFVQQIARAVYDDVCSDEELELVRSLGKDDGIVEGLKTSYYPYIVDSSRVYFNPYKILSLDIFKVWFKIGIKHPKEYWLAFADQTQLFWYPVSSGEHGGIGMYKNDYGLVNEAKLFDGSDVATDVYNVLAKVKLYALLCNAGFTFWLILLCMYLCARNKNSLGAVMCVPYLAIYIGLFIFSYGGLFRYAYAAVLGMSILPVFYLFDGVKDAQEGSWDE